MSDGAQRPPPGKPPLTVCPACGSDDVQTLIGSGRLCLNCGHWFSVIDGKAQDFEDDDDAPDPAA